jgi:hypothetical protein
MIKVINSNSVAGYSKSRYSLEKFKDTNYLKLLVKISNNSKEKKHIMVLYSNGLDYKVAEGF